MSKHNKHSPATKISVEKQSSNVKLNLASMVTGIGRKATDEELTEYLLQGIDDMPIDLDEAFSKFNPGK